MVPNTTDARRMAGAWRPRGCNLEETLSTLARATLRLIDRVTGKSYSADEFEAKILASVAAGTVLERDSPPLDAGLRILGSLTIDGDLVTLPDLIPTGGETPEWTDTGEPADEIVDGWIVDYDTISFRWNIRRVVGGENLAVWYGTDVDSPELVEEYYPLNFGPVPISGVATIELIGTPAQYLLQMAVVNGGDQLYACTRLSPVQWLQLAGSGQRIYAESLTVVHATLLNETIFNDRAEFRDNAIFNGATVFTSNTHFSGKVELGLSSTVTPGSNGGLVFQATSNTSLTVKYKGNDGVVRSAAIPLS
ncbi:hypothetical protein JIN84_17865 [Luteolibacter yonseiensis]|uniref:Uncharacterized protein n=1 Tax=Luteolibacter yonseiensis TaxID=1144680 RepID=A0A934V8Q0_9BACT|nr:hypothetical protein [Luteolibacter yonseiensis]MBK1817492.1 hypothetical protein [Luteolibacter yonseiensis]